MGLIGSVSIEDKADRFKLVRLDETTSRLPPMTIKKRQVGSKLMLYAALSKDTWHEGSWKAVKEYITNQLSYRGYWWTSANDLDSEIKFIWANTARPMRFSKWQPGEPNNHNNIEHCVHLWFDRVMYKMNDWDCNYGNSRFICEIDYDRDTHLERERERERERELDRERERVHEQKRELEHEREMDECMNKFTTFIF
uniref:C-type lectin domain-containing protein n=1 Tax=Glossina brevipalpis TaxID=37001 RepID=A0A1A9WN48_9MUSC